MQCICTFHFCACINMQKTGILISEAAEYRSVQTGLRSLLHCGYCGNGEML